MIRTVRLSQSELLFDVDKLLLGGETSGIGIVDLTLHRLFLTLYRRCLHPHHNEYTLIYQQQQQQYL
jgi:hypothetical protein